MRNGFSSNLPEKSFLGYEQAWEISVPKVIGEEEEPQPIVTESLD